MKTKIVWLFAATWILSFLFFCNGCKKEDATWFKSWHEYELTNINVTNAATGVVEDWRHTIFGFADKMTFQKFGLGSGSGEITIFSTDYKTVDYTTYGWDYNYDCDCYTYNDGTYSITIKKSYENKYHFTWNRRGMKEIRLDISDYDSQIQGTGLTYLLKYLEGPYVVFEDYTLPGRPATAGAIGLKGENGVELVLKY